MAAVVRGVAGLRDVAVREPVSRAEETAPDLAHRGRVVARQSAEPRAGRRAGAAGPR